jgi:hypothetical protein
MHRFGAVTRIGARLPVLFGTCGARHERIAKVA